MMRSMVADSKGLFARVTLPLAVFGLINQAARTVMAIIGPVLAVEFGLSASELGMLAACMLGAYAIAQFSGITFGPLSTATIKLAAIAVAPHAVIFLFELIFKHEFHGALLGWLVSGAVVWWLFCYLFDLDFQEALICAGVTTVLRWFTYLVYWLS